MLMRPARLITSVAVAAAALFAGGAVAQAQTSARPPIGSLDQTIVLGSTITVRGWVLNPDAPTQVGTVHAYVDGTGYVLNPADRERLDVAQAYPGAGANHGFDAQVPLNRTAGQHTVCVYAINPSSGGANPLLRCQTFTLPGTPVVSPVGALDPLEFFADGRPVVRGWAVDPDDINQELEVRLYLDGRYVADLPPGQDRAQRPDVVQATGATDAGFVTIQPVPTPGPHTLCAYGINIGPGTNALLGCRTFG